MTPEDSPLLNFDGLVQLPVDKAVVPAPTDTPSDNDEQSDSSTSVWSSMSYISELNLDEWFLMELSPADAPEGFRVFETPNLPGRGTIIHPNPITHAVSEVNPAWLYRDGNQREFLHAVIMQDTDVQEAYAAVTFQD